MSLYVSGLPRLLGCLCLLVVATAWTSSAPTPPTSFFGLAPPVFIDPVPADTTIACIDDLPAAPDLRALTQSNDTLTISPTETPDPATVTGCVPETITRTWIATDPNTNEADTVTQTITVGPPPAPEILFSLDTVRIDYREAQEMNGPNSFSVWLNSLAFALANPANYTICGRASLSTDAPSDPNPMVGCRDTTTVTYVLSDVCGQTDTAQFTFVTIDTVPPVFDPVSLPLALDTVDCDQVPDVASVVATDDGCGPVDSIRFSTSSTQMMNGTCGQYNYQLIRSWTAVDAAGNESAPFTQTITVRDTTPPTFSAPADRTILCTEDASNLGLTGVVTDTLDNCATGIALTFRNDTLTTSVPDSIIIERTWTATDACGNASSRVQRIVQADTIKPSFTVPMDITVSCSALDSLSVTGSPTDISDNCDPEPMVDFFDDISGGDCAGSLVILRNWTVTDRSGNDSTVVQQITVADDLPPMFTGLPQNLEIICVDDTNLAEVFQTWVANRADAAAVDNCTPTDSLTYFFVNAATGAPATLPALQCDLDGQLVRLDSFIVIVEDACGLRDSAEVRFRVLDQTAPQLTDCPDGFTVPTDPGQCNATVRLEAPQIVDECAASLDTLRLSETAPIEATIPDGMMANQVVVDSIVFDFVLNQPPPVNASGMASLQLQLTNLDGEQPDEYFQVIGEDGFLIGRTAQADQQCGISETTLSLTVAQINAWALDGTIRITLVPFVVEGRPISFAINPVCDPAGSVTANLEIPLRRLSNLLYEVSVDNGPRLEVNPIAAVDTVLDQGTHLITHFVTDCAGNESSCSYTVVVEDQEPPQLQCPSDTTIQVPDTACTATLLLELPASIEDNCAALEMVNLQLPADTAAAWLTFELEPDLGDFIAQEKVFTFDNVAADAFDSVMVTLDLRGDFSSNFARINLIGDDGGQLATSQLGQAGCDTPGQLTVKVSAATFNSWAADGMVTFRMLPLPVSVPPGGPGDGINPCVPGRVTMDGQVDSVSYAFLTLEYGRLQPQYFTTGATEIGPTPFPTPSLSAEITLNQGVTEVFYLVSDVRGNVDTCSYKVTVQDVTPPTAICQQTTLFINPSVSQEIVDATEVDRGSFDNCGIDTLFLTPNAFSCSLAGTIQTVTLTVRDSAGNTATCNTTVAIQSEGPQPTATNGLCGGDTLFLFANPPEAAGGVVYSFEWTNPNGQLFSTQENPVIPNIDEDDEGPYRLRIRSNFPPFCTAEEIILVSIQDLPLTPQITAPTSVCQSETITLTSSTTPPGNNVQFLWYEGISPNGTLLATTTTPEFTVTGPFGIGERRFYLEVEADGCLSAPSSGVIVRTEAKPTATVTFTDTLICEASDINLGVLGQTGVTFQWTGPNAFSSTQQFPTLSEVRSFESGYYYVQLQRGSCLSDPDSILVSVKPLPDRPNISNNGPICQGDELQLSSSATGAAAYHWLAPNGQDFVTNIPSFTVEGATAQSGGNWQLFVTSNGCDSRVSNATTVVVNPNPVATAQTLTNPICSGGEFVLEGTSTISGSSYLWSGPAAFTSLQASPIIRNASESRAGRYELVVTSPAGCRDTANIDIEVLDRVRINSVSSNAPACLNGDVDVTLSAVIFPLDDGSYTYQWTGPGGSGNGSNLTIPNATAAASGNYSLQVFNGEGCPSEVFNYTLDLSFTPPQPAIPSTVSNESAFCFGGTYTLTTTEYTGNDLTYFWTLPNGSTIPTTINSLQISGAGPGNNGNYRVQVVRAGCASPLSIPRNIQVFSVPIIEAQATTSVCEGDVIQLSATELADASYEWFGPSAFTSGLRNPIIQNADPELYIGDYDVVASVNGCVSDTVSVSVNVKERPDPPMVVSSGPVCIDSTDASLILGINSVVPLERASFRWFTGNGQTPIGNSTDEFTFVIDDFSEFDGGQSYNFYARTTVDGCESLLSDPVAVRLDDIPDNAAFAGMDTTVCAGNYSLAAQAPTEGSGQWALLNQGVEATLSNPTSPLAVLSNLLIDEGPYQLAWTLSNGACRNYSSDTLTLRVTQGETAMAGDNILACDDEMVMLGATPVMNEGSVGRWVQPLAQEILGVEIADASDPSTIVTGLVPDNVYSFDWLVEGVCGTSRDCMLVNISDPLPNAGPDQIVCNTDGFTMLQAEEPTVGSRGLWTLLNSSATILDTDDPATSVENLQPGSNGFVWTIDEGVCGAQSSDTVEIIYKVPSQTVTDDIVVPFGEEIEFNPLVNDLLSEGSTVGIALAPSLGSAEVNKNGLITYRPPGNYVGPAEMTYSVLSAGCPEVTGSIRFQIGGDAACIPPNIFTPNNDGVNDFFVVPCLLDVQAYPNSQVIVINRWGDEVYRSPVPYEGDWSGTYSGEELPADTYFYIVEFGDGSEPATGSVMIQR